MGIPGKISTEILSACPCWNFPNLVLYVKLSNVNKIKSWEN
ncbi:hypothetical protein D082_11330 [Synechocystis sp. PCC 6714]|nr:hypothetical protein D082_11330 [Synechocystis sp. PCC 6714]